MYDRAIWLWPGRKNRVGDKTFPNPGPNPTIKGADLIKYSAPLLLLRR